MRWGLGPTHQTHCHWLRALLHPPCVSDLRSFANHHVRCGSCEPPRIVDPPTPTTPPAPPPPLPPVFSGPRPSDLSVRCCTTCCPGRQKKRFFQPQSDKLEEMCVFFPSLSLLRDFNKRTHSLKPLGFFFFPRSYTTSLGGEARQAGPCTRRPAAALNKPALLGGSKTMAEKSRPCAASRGS